METRIRIRSILAITVMATMLSAVFPPVPHAHATASWLTGWSYRQAITVDNAGMTATLTDFPLYVPVASDGAGAGIAGKIQDTGKDIRFTSSDGATTLSYERESYSEASGNVTGNFWVGATLNADNDAATDDTIYLYYGNAGAADGQNRTGVWDSNFKGVWHLSGSTLSALDSTGNANNGTNNGATAAAGKIGNAGSFDGTNDRIVIPDSTSWDFSTGAFSVSMWFKKTSEARGDIFNKKSADSNDDVGLLLEENETMDVYFKIDTVGDIMVSNGHVFTLNAWHYATMVRDGSSNLTTYIDGAPDGTGTSGGNMNNNAADIWIGSNHDDFMVPSLPHTGLIDEIRISNVARSAAWTSFEYNNMNAAGNRLSFAAEEDATDGWPYRKKITIDHTNVDAALTDFPLLVRIDQDTDFGTEAQGDGEDIRFTSSDGRTILPYERESWRVRAGSGSGLFWVKVPSISNSADTTIYAYYGNSGAADGQDAANVWDTNFKGVWHLAETGTNPTAYDSTSNNNDSATQTWTPTVNGKIGGAGTFNGSSNAINITSNDGLNPAVITVTAWVQADVNNKWQYAVLKDGQWDFGRDNNGKYYLAAWKTGPTNVADAHAATTATTGTWEYIAFTYDGSAAKYYVNTTVVINDAVDGNLYTSTNAVNIGSQAAGNYWDGFIDDVKISNVVRSASWLKFEYYNTGAVDNELAWSPEQDALTGKSATTTILTSSDATTGFGQSVTLTATLSPLTATGTATFKNGATTLGTVTLSHGSGSITVSNLAAGTHSLTAEYGGNGEYDVSTSSAVVQTVQGVDTWPYRKMITVDNTNADSDLTNFPLLVKFDQDTDIGGESQSDGEDIRFALSDGTILPYEREDYRVRSGSGSGDFWVKVPTIKASGTGNGSGATIYLYYGSGSAADGADATNVWDSGYAGVWHLNDPTNPADSTSNNNDGTNNGATAATGQMGGAGSFDGTSQYVLLPISDPNIPLTIEMWGNPSTSSPVGMFDSAPSQPNVLRNYPAGWVEWWNSNPNVELSATASQWQHFSFVFSHPASNRIIDYYKNGTLQAHAVGAVYEPAHTWTTFTLGNINGGPDGNYQGSLDEVRISSIARSAPWIKFEYYNNDATDNELAWSAEQSAANGFAGDTTAPVLSDVVSSVTSSTATITWTTDENASSKIQYGTTEALGTLTAETNTGPRVQSHSVSLSALPVCTKYFYRAISRDAAGNTATGSMLNFTTTGCTNSATVSSQTGSNIVTAGGSLSMINGGSGAALTVPASAATNAFTLQIKKIDKDTVIAATSVPSGTSTVGDHTYDIRAISGSTLVTSFLQPITITVEYTDAQVSDYEESTLWIYRWDGSSWNALSSCTVDTSANTVTCTTTHFSTFGLFGTATSTETSDPAGTQSTGGRRGSEQDMAVRIAAARTTILARFEGKRQASIAIASNQQSSASSRQQWSEQLAAEREKQITVRIAERQARIAAIEQTKKDFEEKFAQHREERMAQSVALEQKKLAEEQATLLAEQEELKTEQKANAQRREERLAEREEQDALEHSQEILAAREREARIAQRIADHEKEIARIEQTKKGFEQQFALHREERMARAAEDEQKKLDEAKAALVAEQEALNIEQEANARRREERLAGQTLEEEQNFQAAAPSLASVAERRDRLYAVVNETPVLYADVPLSAWFAPYVSYAVEEQIATGYADADGKPKGEFGVANPVTFAETLKMALKASGRQMENLPPPRNLSAQGTWAASFVAQAESLSLSVFTPQLNVNSPAPRGAVIQTILEVMGIPVAKQLSTFSDVPSDHPYSSAIATAAFYGLISGDTDSKGNLLGTFRPDAPITRAEVAKIIALVKEISK